MLWQPMVERRWRKQPALESMGVGPRRQYMVLAEKFQKPRITPESVSAAYEFVLEVVVGDLAPAVATAWEPIDGGFKADVHPELGWESPVRFMAEFPDLRLQAPPLRGDQIDFEDDDTQPQPLDERMHLRLMVKRRSDAKVAILLTIQTHSHAGLECAPTLLRAS